MIIVSEKYCVRVESCMQFQVKGEENGLSPKLSILGNHQIRLYTYCMGWAK